MPTYYRASLAKALPTPHRHIAQHQKIHAGAQEAVQRLAGGADDRFVFVEGGVKHHRNAGVLKEAVDQSVIAAIVGSRYGLQATGTVHMSNGGD